MDSTKIVEQHIETIDSVQLDFYRNASIQQAIFNRVCEDYRRVMLKVEELEKKNVNLKNQVNKPTG